MSSRTLYIFSFLLIWPSAAMAQRRVVVADAESKLPVRGVLYAVDGGPEERTAWDGLITLPDSFDRVHFSHPQYERRYVLASELRSDTIFLLPNLNRPGEVVIWGCRRFDERMRSMLTPSPQQQRERLPEVVPPGPDILALAAWLFSKTIGPKMEARSRRKKALKEVRRKEQELERRWEMLRDTTARSR